MSCFMVGDDAGACAGAVGASNRAARTNAARRFGFDICSLIRYSSIIGLFGLRDRGGAGAAGPASARAEVS